MYSFPLLKDIGSSDWIQADSKGEKAPPSDSSKKQRDLTESTQKVEPDSTSDDNENAKKYGEEIVKLREQIDNLQQIILEKDEALRIAQNTVDEMSSIYVTLNELRHRVGEKEALIQSTSSQLNNTKVRYSLWNPDIKWAVLNHSNFYFAPTSTFFHSAKEIW